MTPIASLLLPPQSPSKMAESYASLLIRATAQRRSKKLFGLRSTSARFQRKCFFPLSAKLRKIQFMVILTIYYKFQ